MALLLELAGSFALLSLVAIGGANSVLPEMHRLVVDLRGWVSSAQFSELFALAQAAPGPNVLVVSLIGWQVAGFAGALVTTLASCLPTCLLAFFATRWLELRRGAPWLRCLQEGLAPITVGLVLASGYLVTLGAAHGPASLAITVVTVIAVFALSVHPLWWIAAGALAGLSGWV